MKDHVYLARCCETVVWRVIPPKGIEAQPHELKVRAIKKFPLRELIQLTFILPVEVSGLDGIYVLVGKDVGEH